MKILSILQWLLYAPLQILVALVRYPLAPIAVVFFSTKDRKHLRLFGFLETIDNDLGGDSGWVNEHIKPGSDPYSNWNRIKWLWRNGGDWVSYYVIGVPYDQVSGEDRDMNNGLYWDRNYHWMLRKVLFNKVELFWGWNINGPVNGMCKFTFTTRKWSGH